MTPASVASECLKAELDAHHGAVATLPTEVVVILNDAVYGHRFSRPRTSRGALSTIVERPERIKAGVLGISLAYVLLGQRHSEGAIPLHPKRDVNSLGSIPFRIHKTARRLPLLSQAVTNVHGTKWMDELKMMCDLAESKLAMGGKELERRPRSRAGDDATPAKLHEGDLYLCSESLNAIEGALGAVCEGVDTVFGPGPRRAFVGVRPPGHHCSASHPSGFCWVNNVHVGIMHAALTHNLTHAAILDFDLHHGDGSQAITWQHNRRSAASSKNAAPWKKTSIGYFSLHDINSYPCEGGDDEKVKNASLCIDNAHGQSIWNVHLEPWRTEAEFWELYETKYSVLLEKTRIYLRKQAERCSALNQKPRAVIFLSAGFDASEWESAGMQRHQANVPTEFYARVAQDVVKIASEEGLGVDGRVISVLEGGYSDRALFSGASSHLAGLVGSQKLGATPTKMEGLGSEMGKKMNAVVEESIPELDEGVTSTNGYDPAWWSSSELDKLESLIGQPAEPPRKPRQPTPSTYSSPTQASTAKVVDPIKMRRSLSGLSTTNKVVTRPPSPPPPEVPWHVATHELSKLLIPSSRQTESCKPEDLNAEATRARQARQTYLGATTEVATPDRPTSKMALRGRKPKPAVPISEEDVAHNRRKTVATTTVTPAKVCLPQDTHGGLFLTRRAQGTPRAVKNGPAAPQSARRSSRRLSGASRVMTPTDEDVPPLPAPPFPISNQPGASSVEPAGGPPQSAGALPVKKTRTPTTNRKEPSAKGGRGANTPSKAARPTARSEQPQQQQQAGTAAPGSGDDLDNITSGMKKIKINLITQAQREAREKSRTDTSESSAPTPSEGRSSARSGRSTPHVPPTPELHSNVPSLESAAAPPPPGVVPAPDTSIPEKTYTIPDLATPPEPRARSPKKSQRSSPTVDETPSLGAPTGITDDLFVAYQPEGPPPVAATQSEPLKWLPPNIAATPSANTPAATPSPVKRQDNLFHYTPGSIPFAPRPKSPNKMNLPPVPREDDKSGDAAQQ